MGLDGDYFGSMANMKNTNKNILHKRGTREKVEPS
jgi:hypothetical protein